MALTRVQATGKVTADSALSVAITFATPPTIGNGLVIPIALYNTTVLPSSCTDNRGNTYQLAKNDAGISPAKVAIYYCAKVTASAAPFTITVSASGTGYYAASAIEVSGVGSGLMVDQATSGRAATGTAVARLSQLPVEVLRASSPPVLRLSQLPIEILRGSQPAPSLRLSQLPIEILRSPSTPEVVIVPVRLSQLPIEVLRAAPPRVRLSQLPIEILRSPATPEPTTPTRLSQLPIEILLGSLGSPPPALRLSQLPVEVLLSIPPPPSPLACAAGDFPIDSDLPGPDDGGIAPAGFFVVTGCD